MRMTVVSVEEEIKEETWPLEEMPEVRGATLTEDGGTSQLSLVLPRDDERWEWLAPDAAVTVSIGKA